MDPMEGLRQATPELLAYSAIQVTAYIAMLPLVRRVWPKHQLISQDPYTVADAMPSLIIFPVLTAAAMSGTLKLGPTFAGRWTGVVPESSFFVTLYVSRSLVHFPMLYLEDISRALFLAMCVHHILSIICIGSALVTGRMHFWACLDGCCEMSTAFLNIMILSRDLIYKDRVVYKQLPTLMAINGVTLWLAFIVFRICLFPVWLYMFHADLTAHPELWETCSAVEKYLAPSVTALLLGLSTMWLIAITKGMLKAVRNLKADEKQS